ncbi:hypothetical protein SeLEV6574_g02028 [Synchytrium endobioticum]|nr:hypothetical protein SeLEV6574_g02028 [Synchytrium endobioticum]
MAKRSTIFSSNKAASRKPTTAAAPTSKGTSPYPIKNITSKPTIINGSNPHLCMRASSRQIASRSIHPEPPSHSTCCPSTRKPFCSHNSDDRYEELSRENRDLRIRLQHLLSLLSEQSKIINTQQPQSVRTSKDQDALVHDLRHRISQLESDLSLRRAERDSLQFIVDELQRRVRHSCDGGTHLEHPSVLSSSAALSAHTHGNDAHRDRMFHRSLRDDDSWLFSRPPESSSPSRAVYDGGPRPMREEASLLNDEADELAFGLHADLDIARHVEKSLNHGQHAMPQFDGFQSAGQIQTYLPPLPKATSLSPENLFRDFRTSPDRQPAGHTLHVEASDMGSEASATHIELDDYEAWRERASRLEKGRNEVEETLLRRYSELQLGNAEERMEQTVAEPDANSLFFDDLSIRNHGDFRTHIMWTLPPGTKHDLK